MNNRNQATDERITVQNHLDGDFRTTLHEDVTRGLSGDRKTLPCKYFYDANGSRLFEEICQLPEYYPTRTEMGILREAARTIMAEGADLDLIELGAGANWKIRMLLDAVPKERLETLRYVPVDVSGSALTDAAEELAALYPALRVRGVVADFTKHLDVLPNGRRRLMIFFGSTIGNFTTNESVSFLSNVAAVMNREDRFLLGLDMIKPEGVIEAAYNDSRGVTEDFNKNVMNVINRELNANFDPDHFDHVAFFNAHRERVEMHLRANRELMVEICDLDMEVRLHEGETIMTEICRKFTRQGAEEMFAAAGLQAVRWFTDPKGWFSLVELRPE